jgi:hypothetical protein
MLYCLVSCDVSMFIVLWVALNEIPHPTYLVCPCILDVISNIDFKKSAPYVENAWKVILADKLGSTIEMTLICESLSHKCININKGTSDAAEGANKAEKLDCVSAKESLLIPDSCYVPFHLK